ncbi:MAG: hypothetical protein U0768_18010 [Anaerolineae bacterium]
MLSRRILIAALIVLAPALWAVSLAAASQPGARPAAPQAAIDAVYGQVLGDNDAPVSGVDVFLQQTAGGVATTVLTATTTITGYYEFLNPPPLQVDELYNVVYGPQDTDPRYVNVWYGPDINDTDTGWVPGGTLHIADVVLAAPPDNAQVSFPVTFQWLPRSVITESYYVGFLDPNTSTLLPSNPVGHQGSLTLTSVGDVPGLQTGKQYAWLIAIESFDETYRYSFGYSLARRNVTFNAATTATPTATATATDAPTGTPTATNTPVSATATPTPTATNTSAPATVTPTRTPTATQTSVAATSTPTATATAPPATHTPTATPTPTATSGTPSHAVYLPLLVKAASLTP